MQLSKKSISLIVISCIVALFALITAFSTAYTVDQGERGVVLRNGKVIGTADPGFHFKLPFVDKVEFISIRDFSVKVPLEAYSRDQQPASIVASLTFSIPEGQVSELYSQYGNINNFNDRVIQRRMPDVVKNSFGKYTAERSIQEREKLVAETYNAVAKSFENTPARIVSLQYEEIGFSQNYEKSIEQRMLAEVEKRTREQQEATNAIDNRIVVAKAQAVADSNLAHAKAQAEATRIQGEADAYAISVRADALAKNKDLVQLNAVEKWDGKLPATQVPGSTLPFINIK